MNTGAAETLAQLRHNGSFRCNLDLEKTQDSIRTATASGNSMKRLMTRRSLTALIMAVALLAGNSTSLGCSQCEVQKLEVSSCYVPSADDGAALACSCCLTEVAEDSGPVGVLAGQGQTIPDAQVALSRTVVATPIGHPPIVVRFGLARRDIPGPPLYLVKHSYLI